MSGWREELDKLKELLAQEKRHDFEQYQKKILTASLAEKVNQGICWYPVSLKRTYIGMGERNIIEVTRTRTDNPHSFQSGNVVRLFSNSSDGRSDEGGVINYIKDNTMVITLHHDDLPDWINDGKLGVDLLFDEGSYKEMETAVEKVIRAEKGRVVELRELLLGYKSPTFTTAEPVNHPELNESQNLALNKALEANDVAIVHGPPGTGKTTTLTHAIKETIKRENQTLVCAPSNAAVDLLVEKLTELGVDALRIGHPARVNEVNLSRTMDARIAAHESFRDIKKLRKKAEELRRIGYQYKRNYGAAERAQRKAVLNEARRTLADADMLEHYIVTNLLNQAQVIACTLVGASHSLLAGKTFKTVFIDEAAQALEPACWIPILKAERVVFAGDHRQLPPTIKSAEAARNGLAETLFEKCATRTEASVMLRRQYRMHRDIMNFSSGRFYENNLIADDSVRDRLLLKDDQPVLFIDTAGCGFIERVNSETKSIYNTEEASLLVNHLASYAQTIGHERIINEDIRIGVIAPYKAHATLLGELISENPDLQSLLPQIAVDTVDAFQGRERDIIYIGMVRSNSEQEIGFLKDIRRMNVAMTRARMKLVMIGDSATLGSFPFYNDLLDYVTGLNAYASAYEFMY